MRENLGRELSAMFPRGEISEVGSSSFLVATSSPLDLPLFVAYSIQSLPAARKVTGTSVRELADAVMGEIFRSLPSACPAWRLGVFGSPGDARVESRGALLEEQVLERIEDRSRKLLRSRVSSSDPFHADETTAQVLLVAPDTAFVSFVTPDMRVGFEPVLSPMTAGRAEVENDPRPPARAYQKLLEAEAQLGVAIGSGDRCVDLGCTPGSWSYIALTREATVVGVDRAEPDQEVTLHEQFTFQRGDGFAYTPSAPVHWLLCDIVAPPQQTLELLQRWLRERWCEKFIVTFKFKGDPDIRILTRLKELLRQQCGHAFVRHLTHNKNEVTAAGVVKPFRS
ncbi:MAG: hypothetical protein IT290_04840 [Deltaproteobacteria bacterium]|nr:hypothetical protein [Deltaproteobacteria bacterium]